MTVDLHLLIWAAFGLGCAAYLYHIAMTRRRVRAFEPVLLVVVFLVVLMGPLKFSKPSDTADRQARTLEWEMQQRITQPLPDRVEVPDRISFEERLLLERQKDTARTQTLRESLIKDAE